MFFDESRLGDPSYYSENRVPAHSDHVAYATAEEAEVGESSLRVSLNGLWKFFHAINPKQVIPGFESAEYDCKPWTDIPVPAHIQMEGYGVPQYCNVQYPWDGLQDLEVGQVATEYNPVACYAKYFFLPESMKGKRVFVSFQGAESCVAVWINGHYVGYSSDSFTPDEFELTPYLVEGENKLACRVYRWNAGSWLEDQDFMRFSGLFREVYLYARPAVHLDDVKIKTLLDEEYVNADLEVTLKVSAAGSWRCLLWLKDGEELVATTSVKGQKEEETVTIPVCAPKKWSSESPYLYDLVLEMVDADGNTTEVVRQKVGFRKFEIKGGVMRVNGVRVVFKGTNRHDYCAETGRAVTYEKVRRDLITMKRNNINAVRTSHYPNNSALYAICDELGLYVIDENNMETHGVWDMVASGRKPIEYSLPGDRREWQDMMLDRVNSTYQRDKNHPCVVIWSCGNESFGGSVIFEMSQLFRKLDDTRIVHYEGIARGRDPRFPGTTDIYSEMYTPIDSLREFQKDHRDKPMILCEYTHSMGNSNGAMHLYTEYAYEEDLYQGGFIWDFLDQSVLTKDRYGRSTLTYGGDMDDRPHDGNFSGNGIVFGDGSPTPKLQEVKYNYQNIVAGVENGKIRIKNRNMFTDTTAFDCLVILEKDGKEIRRAAVATHVPPLSEGIVPMPFEMPAAGGEYAVTVSFRLKEDTAWAEKGYEVAFGQTVIDVPKEEKKIAAAPLRVVRGAVNVGVIGNNFKVLFGMQTGGMSSYQWGGKEMFKAYPMPNFWRAPIDNDRGNALAFRRAQWKIASMYVAWDRNPENKPFVTENEDGTVSVTFNYVMPTVPASGCRVVYTVHPTGKVDVKLSHDPVKELKDMPEFGMIMKMDAGYDRIRWYGNGPEECYVDRQEGAKLGIWQKKVADNMTRYLLPQECGNHTGVRWAEVTDAKGRGLRFSGDKMEFSALPYTPHEIENALHDFELPPVQYTVIRANLMQMGVGGDDSWGARTHPEYLIDVSKPMEFTFSFEGIV